MPDLLDDIFAELGGAAGEYYRLSYSLTGGNRNLMVLSTPNLWGQDPSHNDYEKTVGRNLITAVKTLISSATRTVDISTLIPWPNGLFLEAIRDGIKAASAKQPIVVRIIVGTYGEADPMSRIIPFLNALQIPAGVAVYAGAMTAGGASWNHSKIIIVDGHTAITGGHNSWSETYCDFAPVHDCSMQLTGPAVATAQSFLNLQWQAVARYSRTGHGSKWYWSRMQLDGTPRPNALPAVEESHPAPGGPVRALSLARLGDLVPPSPSANASRTARIAAVRGAKSTIRFSQQKMIEVYPFLGDKELFGALADRVIAGVNVYVIQSDVGAGDHTGKPNYSGSVWDTAAQMASYVRARTGKSGQALVNILRPRVHIAPVRFSYKKAGDPEAGWWKWRRDGVIVEPGNHAKVYIIDDKYFYVGSDNAYPIPFNNEGLQEFGFLVGSETETKKFIEDYWDQFWQYASLFEFSDWERLTDSVNVQLSGKS